MSSRTDRFHSKRDHTTSASPGPCPADLDLALGRARLAAWRAERGRPTESATDGEARPPSRRHRPDLAGNFAAAIAREELGRSYWGEAQERQLRRALSRPNGKATHNRSRSR